jgi:hypothetical protein
MLEPLLVKLTTEIWVESAIAGGHYILSYTCNDEYLEGTFSGTGPALLGLYGSANRPWHGPPRNPRKLSAANHFIQIPKVIYSPVVAA